MYKQTLNLITTYKEEIYCFKQIYLIFEIKNKECMCQMEKLYNTTMYLQNSLNFAYIS